MDGMGEESIVVQKKSGVGKRVGYFFLALLPALVSIAAQLAVGVGYAILNGFIKMAAYTNANPDATQLESMLVYNDAVMQGVVDGIALYHVLSIPCFGLWYYFGCGRPKMKASIKNSSLKAGVIALVGGAIICFFSNGLIGVESMIAPEAVEEFANSMNGLGIGQTFFMTLAAIILAPIGEEILCRGITLHYAKKALPKFWMANVLQALMFGVMHGNVIQGSYAFVIGLFAGYLAERYHSLIPCMVMHFAVNFSTTVWVGAVLSLIPETPVSYILMMAIPLLVIFALVCWGGSVKGKVENADAAIGQTE